MIIFHSLSFQLAFNSQLNLPPQKARQGNSTSIIMPLIPPSFGTTPASLGRRLVKIVAAKGMERLRVLNKAVVPRPHGNQNAEVP